jgi:aryl-alcohol dehydrogenase-like predicted oxidoreductase
VQTRPLGTTGLRVSEIGFGAWGLGGSAEGAVAYGPVDAPLAVRVLRRAYEEGVTFYDTADLYGRGRSEELIGRALGGVRAQVVLASKAGRLDDAGAQDFSPAHLRASLEGSLRRLGPDYLDLYQLHDPPRDLLERDERIWRMLEVWQREGTVRALGVSVRSPEDGLLALERLGARCLQVNFNLADQRALDSGLLARCQSLGAGVIVRTPLCFGFLSGACSAETPFAAVDHRSRWASRQRALWAEAPQRFAAIRAREEQSLAQFALRFCLSSPAVSTVIPGMLSEAEVEDNVQASRLGPLQARDRLEAEAIYRHHEFFLSQPAEPAASGARS